MVEIPKQSVSDSLINLLVAFILIYVGVAVFWSVNPFLAVLFVLLALYIVARAVRSGRFGL